MGDINTFVNSLSKHIPRNTDILTTQARLDHTRLNATSINRHNIFLSILVVILVTIAFGVHLTE